MVLAHVAVHAGEVPLHRRQIDYERGSRCHFFSQA
jgi:hypothetical protein